MDCIFLRLNEPGIHSHSKINVGNDIKIKKNSKHWKFGKCGSYAVLPNTAHRDTHDSRWRRPVFRQFFIKVSSIRISIKGPKHMIKIKFWLLMAFQSISFKNTCSFFMPLWNMPRKWAKSGVFGNTARGCLLVYPNISQPRIIWDQLFWYLMIEDECLYPGIQLDPGLDR